ncbi:enoyl-CoA hydratase/carnithine racemase [Sphingomonas zeicaulis]|uniref:enoyl-CoA hydratase/isomerase family protein n=1 Tax=Sphingomonas zeicaulis TaxID=1632740 RepID=UPI003D25F6B6
MPGSNSRRSRAGSAPRPIDAWFQLPELAMGILPGAGGTVSVPRRIGRKRAALLMLSGRRIDAHRARDGGLVDAIMDEDAVDDRRADIGGGRITGQRLPVLRQQHEVAGAPVSTRRMQPSACGSARNRSSAASKSSASSAPSTAPAAVYDAMLRMRRVRKRNGGFGWAVLRDLADRALWTERFEFPTWQDYLRNR